MRSDQRDEISASVAARRELGPDYDEALAEGLGSTAGTGVQALLVVLIWVAITVINVGNARLR